MWARRWQWSCAQQPPAAPRIGEAPERDGRAVRPAPGPALPVRLPDRRQARAPRVGRRGEAAALGGTPVDELDRVAAPEQAGERRDPGDRVAAAREVLEQPGPETRLRAHDVGRSEVLLGLDEPS